MGQAPVGVQTAISGVTTVVATDQTVKAAKAARVTLHDPKATKLEKAAAVYDVVVPAAAGTLSAISTVNGIRTISANAQQASVTENYPKVQCEQEYSAHDINQYERLKSQYAANEVYNAERVRSALKDDIQHRAASYLSESQLSTGRVNSLTGGDDMKYTLLRVKGGLNGNNGVFEYITNSSGQVTHQRFINGGVYTGFPNQFMLK